MLFTTMQWNAPTFFEIIEEYLSEKNEIVR